MNQEGEVVPSGAYAGEEYIPTYSPLVLDPSLLKIHTTLFGTEPDHEGRLYRAAQYMAVLHSTEFVEYVTALDNRVTYDASQPGLMSLEYGTVITTTSPWDLSIIGSWQAPRYKGVMRNDWVVEATGANQILVRHVQSGTTMGMALVFAGDGSSESFALPESDLRAVITAETGLSGDRWEIRHRLPLEQTLPDVVSGLEAMNLTTRQALFGLGRDEPYLTFRNLFDKHQALPFRLSGALLALIYRMEAQRNP